MQPEHYRDLWEKRFKKILKLEEDSFLFYRRLLRRNEALFEGTRGRGILERMLREELRHARVARSLIHMVRQKNLQGEPGKK